MRPLGALLLGAYIDRHGRRAGLLATLTLMSFGTLSIALTPGYGVLGVLAPLLVVIGRLLQGFSAGVELGGVSVYLAEIAPPGHKGFYVSWQSGSQQIAVVFVALLGVFLSHVLTPLQIKAWGWRIPFLVGCGIIPFIFAIRRSLSETSEFLGRTHRPTGQQVWQSLVRHWPILLIGVFTVTMSTVAFYFITAYTPTFGREVLHLPGSANLLATLCVGVSNLFWIPIMAALSDRIGRRPLLISCSLLTLLTAYPTLSWLCAQPSFGRLLTVELWLSFLYGTYNGAMVIHLIELVPVHVRTAAFSLSYSIAAALFGGFTPAVSTYLIHQTHNQAMPGLWLSLAAGLGLIAALSRTRKLDES
jgi:MFS family permease